MTAASSPLAAAAPPQRTRSLIPLAFVGFFVVVISVNTLFIILARSSFSGLVTNRPYEKGQEIARASAGSLKVDGSFTITGRDLVVQVDARSPQGQPLAGATGHAVLELPSRHAQILRLPLDAVAGMPGRLEGRISLPADGSWMVTAVIQAEGAQRRISHQVEAE